MATVGHGSRWSMRWGLALALLATFCLLSACGGGASSSTANNPCASVAISGTVNPAAAGHLVYQRSAVGPLPAQATWRPGTTMTFAWCATPAAPAQDVGDAQELLTLSLTGPYATKADAQNQSANQPQPLVSAQPITTDTWSATQYTSTLQLPSNLISGYYVVLANVHLGNTTGQGSNGATPPMSSETLIIQVAS